VLARQALYQLSHSTSLFCIAVFFFVIGSYFMPGLASATILLFVLPGIARMTSAHSYAQTLVEMESRELFAQVVLELLFSQFCRLTGYLFDVLAFHISL
jgi:hypothetical protein